MMNCPDFAEHSLILDEEGNVSIKWIDLPFAADGTLEEVQCARKKDVHLTGVHVAKQFCNGLFFAGAIPG